MKGGNDVAELSEDLKYLLYMGKFSAAVTVMLIQSFSFALALSVRLVMKSCIDSLFDTEDNTENQCLSSFLSAVVSLVVIITTSVFILYSYSSTKYNSSLKPVKSITGSDSRPIDEQINSM